MKTFLKILLNFFPSSFRSTMGPAWEEAVESQIKQSETPWKQFQTATSIVFLHFFVSLPQAYSYAALNFMKRAPEQNNACIGDIHVIARIRQRTPERLQKLGFFLIVFSLAVMMGLVLSMFMAWPTSLHLNGSVFENLFIFTKTLIGLSLIISFAFLLLYWDKMRACLLPLLLGIPLGVLSGLGAQFISFHNYSLDKSSIMDFMVLAGSIRSIQSDYPHWYEDGVLNNKYQTQYCTIAKTKLDLWESLKTQKAQLDNYTGGGISSIYNNLYALGCYSKTEYLDKMQFISKLNQKSIQQTLQKTPLAFRYLTFVALPNYNFTLAFEESPRRYCERAFNIYLEKHNLIPLDLSQNFNFCSNQPGFEPSSLSPRHWWEYGVMTPSYQKHVQQQYEQSPRINAQSMAAIDHDIQTWTEQHPELVKPYPSHPL